MANGSGAQGSAGGDQVKRSALADGVVAVTGGARGIGLAIARAFAATGAQVVIGDLDADLAQSTGAELGGHGAGLDVRDDASFAAFLESAAAVGPLRVLVNNAGVVSPGPFLATSADEQALQIAVNLGGVVRGMRLALPGMVARGRGHVVNLSSAAGRVPAPSAAIYSATKHGVLALTDATRSELRGTGVHLTAILPTAVHTEMAAGLTMRGLPQVAPERVARAVVRAVGRKRPPASVMVPRWLRLAAIADAVAPQWLRDLARTAAMVEVDLNPADRATYTARVSRQLPFRE